MTDAEIIKALEFCEENKDNCFTCPVRDDCMRRDMPFIRWAIELIKSQKAEIEMLTKCRKEEVEKLMTATDKVISEAKAEAIKEFVARIEKESFLYQDDECAFNVVALRRIQNIAKETIGKYNNSPIVDNQN